ncbi:MAG: hypothetical protein KOO69_03085, partial [Victivallales bacterium]|nr:hypothetical protein [Victivallales bacterium]
PAAAADAAGGLPLSDAGGLALDTQLANTHEVTAARMGALTDWIDGERLDLLLDAKPTVAQFEARTISPTAAGNMEDTWDGTGYTNDVAPATQAQVGRLSSGSAAIATNPLSSPDGFVIVTGTNEVNTEDATLELDGIVHSLEPDGGVTDCYYIFNVGGNGVPVSVLWYGFANSNLDEYVVSAWNFGTSSWNQVETIAGTPGSVVIFETFILANAHVGTGANVGEVRLGFYSTDGTKISTDRILCTYSVVFQSVGYANGAVWINTNISNENTQPYYDGIVERPVSTLAAAITIATNIGLKRFILLAGSSIILEQAYEGYQFYGSGSVINLNGQSISGSRFYTTSITGDDNGTNPIPALFETCLLAGNLLGVHVLLRCALAGKITLGEEGDYLWDHCVSYVENIIPPVVDYNVGLNASNIHCHHYSGDIETENMGAGTGSYKMSIEGNGHLIINANCSATSTIAISGNMTREDNSGGAVTFVDDARFDVDQITDAVIDDATKIDGSALNALLANDPGETLATTANQTLIYDRIGAPAGVDIAADIATRSSHSAADVWTSGTRTLTSFGTLDADIWNRLTSALTTVGSIGKLLADYIDATISSRSTLSAANVKSEADDALTDIHLDHLLAVEYDPGDKPGHENGLLNVLIEDDDGDARFTEKALTHAISGDATEANQDAILAKLLAYFQLALRSDAAINTDNATELTEINADGGSGAGDYDNQTGSQEAAQAQLALIFADTDFLQKVEDGEWELVSPDQLYFYEKGTRTGPGAGTILRTFTCYDASGDATVTAIARVE